MPATTRPSHFGVTLPQIKRTWQEARETALAIDALKYDSAWVCDHMYGVPNPALPIFEAWSQLAAIAAITEHVQLGTLVTPPFFRNVGVLAKQVATIDHVCSGRTIMGLGAGWFPPEFEAYGNPFPTLGQRMRGLDETAQALRALWTEPSVTLDGEHVHLKDAVCEPKPVRTPPILIGGTGEKVLMGIVARHADIWNNMAITQAQLANKVEVLERRCGEEGRDFDTLTVSQQTVVIIEETEEAARASLAKASKVYGGHMGAGIEEHGIWGTPERVIECIERHRALGCSSFLIEFFGRDTKVPAEQFAETVMPHFRSN
jgi:alkanesulfonate monooxygenase SsuD/methylene tetrahydromethanopterin reductase-like flavin-dependent oxidoreductase (luciferase family)